MGEELEAKFKVANFRAVRRTLRAVGGVYRGTAVQVDTFFDTPDRQFFHTDQCLRLRNIRILRSAPDGLKRQTLLTYKGPRKPHSRVKLRQEIQTTVTDGDAMAEIFQTSGLKAFLKVEKRRASYTLPHCLVELDELPLLGCFVEIESSKLRHIEAAASELALDGEPITESYLNLLTAHCNKFTRSCKEVTFDHCSRGLC